VIRITHSIQENSKWHRQAEGTGQRCPVPFLTILKDTLSPTLPPHMIQSMREIKWVEDYYVILCELDGHTDKGIFFELTEYN
jgi:hypothetical protein